MKALADIIRQAASEDVPPPEYIPMKRPELHLFMWPCRCWIKFRGVQPLPEEADIEDVWALAWRLKWEWLEEGSCSIEHGSDGRPLVSPFSTRSRAAIVSGKPGGTVAQARVLPLRLPSRPTARGALDANELERRAKHYARIERMIQQHIDHQRTGRS